MVILDTHYDPTHHQLVVMRSEGGMLVEHARFAAGRWPTTVQLADLDLDGRVDLVVRGTDRVALASGLGDGTFTEVELLDVTGYELHGDVRLRGIQVGDLNGDGSPEIALAVGPGSPTYADLLIIRGPLGSPAQTAIATALIEGSQDTEAEMLARDFTDDGVADIAVTTNVEGSHLAPYEKEPWHWNFVGTLEGAALAAVEDSQC